MAAHLCSSKIIELPLPQYIVFYNGSKEEPEKSELSIREAFAEVHREKACLDFTATMLNINLGYNKDLMTKCKRLHDYAVLISRIREYLASGHVIEDAVNRAVDDCIRENILADILSKNKAEVFEMILTEYNEQNHIANEKKISHDEGVAEGISQGISRGLVRGKAEAVLDILTDYGEISDSLRECILQETDMEILTGWLKLAVRAGSLEAFEEAIIKD